MLIEGHQFRGPSVPVEEINNTIGINKRNYTLAFDRPPFVNNVLLPKKDQTGRICKV